MTSSSDDPEDTAGPFPARPLLSLPRGERNDSDDDEDDEEEVEVDRLVIMSRLCFLPPAEGGTEEVVVLRAVVDADFFINADEDEDDEVGAEDADEEPAMLAAGATGPSIFFKLDNAMNIMLFADGTSTPPSSLSTSSMADSGGTTCPPVGPPRRAKNEDEDGDVSSCTLALLPAPLFLFIIVAVAAALDETATLSTKVSSASLLR